MSEFTPIQTQEDFDKAIKSRLAQKDRELAEKFKDYLSPEQAQELKSEYEKKIGELNGTVKEAQDKLKTFDTTVSELTKRAEMAEKTVLKSKIASQHQLPVELAERLVGETEEELNKDAESLARYVGTGSTPPLHSHDNPAGAGSSSDVAMLNLLQQLTGKSQ